MQIHPDLEIPCAAAKQLLDTVDDLLLLDCRETEEFDLVAIQGATLLPMSEIAERHEEIAEHKNRPVIVYCHHGGRSAQVANFLRKQGFHQAQSMAGGIDVWAQEIDQTLTRY